MHRVLMIELSDLDDAVCVIEIGPPVGGNYDVVTSLELARAAFSIVEGCVSNVELGRVGGEVRGLGASNGSGLILFNHSSVTCVNHALLCLIPSKIGESGQF